MTASARRALPVRLALALSLVVLCLSGCATMYVDNGLKDIPEADYPHPQAAQPVQLLFQFQSKGTLNTRATDFLKQEVTDTVTRSHLFASVSHDPVASGSILSITINNVPLTDDAFSKGFATGLTFGLAGNVVTDGYVCTAEYVGGPGQAKIVKSRSHAIHTTMGAKGAPANAVKAASPKEAVETMARQIVGNTLKDLATDSNFKL